MSHPYEARENARREISRLVALAELRIGHARRAAEHEARARAAEISASRGSRSQNRCTFAIGKSGETKEMRAIFEERFARNRAALEPELEALRRKIQRTIRFFGFNDIEIRF